MNTILSPSKSKIKPQEEEIYRALVRNLRRHLGFGILFVCCTPEQEQRIIKQVEKDILQKKIVVLSLEEEIYNLYELIEEEIQQQPINICFITGIEKSFVNYIKPGIGGQGDYYKTDTVPPILGHLNLQRERFRDNFNCCLVFFVPWFGLKYFVRRSPDFYDWRSGVFCFPVDEELIEQESSRILEDRDYQRYLQLTPEERNQKILELKDLITESQLSDAEKAELWHEIGRLYDANQEYVRALACFDQALEIKPDYHKPWYGRGNVLFDLGRLEEAIASYNKALEIKPDYHEAWNNRGVILYNLGRLEEAIASYDKALEIKSDYHKAWNNRGLALHNLGRLEEAIASWDKGLEFKPDDYQAWNNRGVALENLGRLEEAIASYNKAIELQPDFSETWYNRGVTLRILGQTEEAITSYDKAIELQPNFAKAWYKKAWALQNLGQYQEAIISYDKAIELNPKHLDAWDNRGIALMRSGRYEEALNSYNQALQLNSEVPNPYYNKACCYGLQNNVDLAIENLQQAINLDQKYRDMAKTDNDFDRIRSESRFQALLSACS